MIRTFSAFALCALLAAPATAGDRAGQFAIKGAGGASCQRFTRALGDDAPEVGQFLGWARGYLTRLNQTEPDTFDILPWQDARFLVVSLGDHCARNPAETFGAAVAALARSLEPQRLTARSPLLELEQGPREGTLYEEVLRRVQQRLVALGEAGLDVTGALDAPTVEALRAFQSAEGLEASGFPDQGTLLRLFYPASGGASPR